MKRVGLIFVGLLMAACLVAAPAIAGKKDDTLVWATDRDNPIADPFYLNTRELVVIGHHVWDTLVIIDPEDRPRSNRCWRPSGTGSTRPRSRWSCGRASSSTPAR